MDGGRQKGVLTPGLAQLCFVVEILKSHGEGLLFVGRIGKPGLAIVREHKVGFLILDDGFLLVGGVPAIGHSFVVSPYLKPKALAQFQVHLPIGCRKRWLTVERSSYGLGCRSRLAIAQLQVRQGRQPCFHPDHVLVVVGNGKEDSVADCHLVFSVGRADSIVFGRRSATSN